MKCLIFLNPILSLESIGQPNIVYGCVAYGYSHSNTYYNQMFAFSA